MNNKLKGGLQVLGAWLLGVLIISKGVLTLFEYLMLLLVLCGIVVLTKYFKPKK